MKKYLIALAASAAIMGAAHAQQGSPTETDTELDSSTVPAEQAEPQTSTDAPSSGEDPTATDAETDASTVVPRIVPQTGTSAPQSGPDEPTATDAETDATTVQ